MNTLSTVSSLQNKFSQLDRKLTLKEGQHSEVLRQKQQLETQIIQQKEAIILSEKISLVVQKLTELARKDTLDKVANIVTTALQQIKDPNLSFRINYKVEKGQAEFVIYNSKLKQEMGIMESSGGTLVDIVDFALRVSLMLKWQPQLSRVLILDESFKFVSVADRDKLASFIRELSEKLDLQIILVTHESELSVQAHKVFRISHDGIKSEIQAEQSEQI